MACEPGLLPANRADDAVPNFRVQCYAVVLFPVRCERCGCSAQRSALWLPPMHEMRDDGDQSAEDVWHVSNECRLLHEVTWIQGAARSRLREWQPNLRIAPRPSDGARLWINHCEHCSAPVWGTTSLDGSPAALWMHGAGDALVEVMPVPEPLVATALSWTVGDLPDKVLDAIAAEAAREAASIAP